VVEIPPPKESFGLFPPKKVCLNLLVQRREKKCRATEFRGVFSQEFHGVGVMEN